MRLILMVGLMMIFCLAYPISGQTTDNNSTPPVRIEALNDHLYVITVVGGEEYGLPPYGTNLIASVGGDGILLVDAGFNSTGAALYDTLKTMGNGDIKFVINTHYHGDHASANHYFRNNAVIMGHRNAYNRMSGNYYYLEGPPDHNRPTVGFGDSLIIHFNDETVRLIHAPNCHTRGDIFVHFVDSKIIAAGDLFFPDEIPYIDLPDNGSVKGYIRQIDDFINSYPDDITFIAAHGRYYKKEDLINYNQMLRETSGLIHKAADDGMTTDEMVAENIMADWAEWEGQFPTTTLAAWILTNYAEYTSGGNLQSSICEPVTKALAEGTVLDAIDQYHTMKSTQPDKYDFSEGHLNMLGYQLLARHRVDEALDIFKLNIEAYPDASNVYDSYGEALMIKGDTALSIINYEKSLELNPDNINAVEMLKRLRLSK